MTPSMPWCFLERLRGWARDAPTRTAVVDEHASLSYGALLQEGLCLAERLAADGLGDGSRVGFVGSSRSSAVLALVASGSLGGTVVLVDPSSGPAAVARALSAYPCDVLIEPVDGGVVSSGSIRYRRPPKEEARSASESNGHREEPGVGAVVFTSGSTGDPKGVLVSRSALDASAVAVSAYLDLRPGDAGTLLVPISARMGLSTILAHLWVGSTLVLGAGIPGGRGETLRRSVEFESTSITCVPTHLRILVERGLLTSSVLPRLRTVRVGAGALSSRDIQRTARALPAAEILLTYGTSETGEISVARGEDLLLSGCVGTPLPDVRLAILDGMGRPVAEGGTGEIAVAGPRVMMGYHDGPAAPDQTHRTGDLGRLSGGRLFLEGRAREMVKSAGESISPLAVERVLRDQPGVADAAVVGIPDSLLGEAPIAFVVTQPGVAPPDPGVLRAACAATLSRLSVPRRIVFVERIPRLFSGKPDRSALLAFAGTGERP